jgi:hypothetical protein
MRVLLAVGALVLAMAASAVAQPRLVRPEYRWCYIEPPYYIQHCMFNSIEECRLEIPGMGGYCNLNSRYVEPPPAGQPKMRKRSAR